MINLTSNIAGKRDRHGLSRHRFYNTWQNMMSRCYYEKDKAYKNYGGRGISVHKDWHSPAVFVAWAESTYIKGLTLERSDNDGNYTPNNCTWATKKEQVRNTRRVKLSVEIAKEIRFLYRNGFRVCVLADIYGVNKTAISSVLRGINWN